MSEKVTLQAQERERTGKGGSRTSRREGKIPAVIYGTNLKNPISIEISSYDFGLLCNQHPISRTIVEIEVGGKTYKTLPKALQKHPVTDKVEHIDFLAVKDNDKVKVRIPTKFSNRSTCPGVKMGGKVNVAHHYVDMICPVTDIIQIIDVDMGELNLGQSITLSSLDLNPKCVPVKKYDLTLVAISGRGGKTAANDEDEDNAGSNEGSENDSEAA